MDGIEIPVVDGAILPAQRSSNHRSGLPCVCPELLFRYSKQQYLLGHEAFYY